jgi:porin
MRPSSVAVKGVKAAHLITAMPYLGLLLSFSAPAQAQPVEVPATWGGDIWSRPRLTGNWGGLRDDLGKQGVVFDVDLLATPQAVVSGGKDQGSNFWNNVDYTLNLDTGKAGLWPGGFLKISADTGFGSNVLGNTGAIVPVNTAALFPGVGDETTGLTNATFMQFLSTKFALFFGKIDTFDLSGGEFLGDYRTQFMNTALVAPMTLDQVPLSAFGGGLIALPWEGTTLSVLVLDSNGTPTGNDLGHAFEGVVLVGSAKVTIKPFGLIGHQNLGFTWSDKDRFSLDQDPSNIFRLLAQDRFPRLGNPGPILSNIFARFFPSLLVPTQPAGQKSDSWSISYGFDQYFWQPDGDPTHGIGVFFSFGAADGNPNPIKYSYIFGIGGKGVVPGRPDDSFGIGFVRTEFSSDFLPFLRQNLNLGLDHDDAIEIYYNAALTPWLSVTPDLQIVGPALNQSLNSNRQLTTVDTGLVLGLRARVRF